MKPNLPYRRFAEVDGALHVSQLIESEKADPGFPALVEDAADGDWEAILRRGRYGFLVGTQGVLEVLYADDQVIRAWAAETSFEVSFAGG